LSQGALAQATGPGFGLEEAVLLLRRPARGDGPQTLYIQRVVVRSLGVFGFWPLMDKRYKLLI
jgi:hypothetical protein